MTVKDSTDYECGDGWRNLVDTAIDQIRATDQKIRIDQVKQKMGGLKIHYHPHNEVADNIVEITEEIASQTCEQCGAAARTQKVQGWWETLCAQCVSIMKNE
jgi:NMD protein affecting ribosome stability and mRNA decay